MENKEIENLKNELKEEINLRIENALVEMHSANMSFYWELMNLIKSDRLRYKYVVSFLSAAVHLTKLDEKDMCERGIRALADNLSAMGEMIKINEADMQMARSLATEIEFYNEDLSFDLHDILAWFDVSEAEINNDIFSN